MFCVLVDPGLGLVCVAMAVVCVVFTACVIWFDVGYVLLFRFWP